MKLTSGVREQERRQGALDRLVERYEKVKGNFPPDSAYLLRLTQEIEALKKKIGV